jgi:hypothetical protein
MGRVVVAAGRVTDSVVVDCWYFCARSCFVWGPGRPEYLAQNRAVAAALLSKRGQRGSIKQRVVVRAANADPIRYISDDPTGRRTSEPTDNNGLAPQLETVQSETYSRASIRGTNKDPTKAPKPRIRCRESGRPSLDRQQTPS